MHTHMYVSMYVCMQNQLKEKGFVSAYRLQFITNESLGRNTSLNLNTGLLAIPQNITSNQRTYSQAVSTEGTMLGAV